MKCQVCEQDKDKGFITPMGFVCEEESCVEKNRAEWKAILDREQAAELDDLPEECNLHDFERFALRLAVKYLDQPGVMEKIIEANPMMADPSTLSMEFKEMLINHAPDYFSTWEARGHERLFHGGQYRLIGKIPRKVLFEAAAKAHILHRAEDDSEEGGDGEETGL